MRLQRLTNLEILTLRKEYAELLKLIANLKAILASEKKLMNVIKKELMEIREKFADPRRTELVDSFQEIVIEPEAPVADETAVVLTRAGFVKRMPPKALEKADKTDAPAQVLSCFTDEKLLFITDLGNCYPVPVSQIPECRPRDRGIALGGLLAGLEKGENLVSLTPAGNYEGELLFATQNGLVKRTACAELNVRKSRFACISLKGDDRLAAVLCPRRIRRRAAAFPAGHGHPLCPGGGVSHRPHRRGRQGHEPFRWRQGGLLLLPQRRRRGADGFRTGLSQALPAD